MKNSLFLGAGLLAAAGVTLVTHLGAVATPAGAQSEGGERGSATLLTTTRITAGLVRPIFVTHAPGDFSRLYIIEKQGRIRIFDLNTNTLLATPFLDVDAITVGGTTEASEQGLLGLAFHPNYATNGYFWIYYTATSPNGANTVARYTRSGDPNVANPSGDIILQIADSFTNHNGGWMDFGPDGYLYISTGDGGSSCDPSNNAQNTNVLLGKMLRIDVDGPNNIPGDADDDGFPADPNRDYTFASGNPFIGGGGAGEVWSYGLRNAWRPSFDRANGDLYIADVGQSLREEINYQAAGAGAGRNYGWDCEEGLVCSSLPPSNCTSTGCVCGAAGFTDPIWQYDRGEGRCSITGGYVYRGCAIPDLLGTYFYADYCSGQIFTFDVVGGVPVNQTQRTSELAPGGGLSIASITSFGQDAYGELYICDSTGGEVFKIIPRTFVGPDCNSNGRRDACDILNGSATDANSNGIPDSCEVPPCPADLNGDGQVGAADLAALLGSWGAGGPADFDGGGVSASDLAFLLGSWGPC